MSVYTPVSEAALAAWLADHEVGELTSLAGIAEGVENSNFFVDTSAGRFVLTLFERLDPWALDFYLGLMRHLARAGVPCPAPQADRQDRLHSPLCGKPAALVARLIGTPVERPAPAHCAAIGRWLADMHLAADGYSGHLPNPRGAPWREYAAGLVARHLPPSARALLEDELRFQAAADLSRLPRGLVHADLFRDNALFADPQAAQLGGVIDFYFAGEDCLLFDLAVAANDWCIDAVGELDAARVQALLAAYSAVRPLGARESERWPTLLRAGALRFWLSRLLDAHMPRAGEMVRVKDPAEFERILELRRRPGPLPWFTSAV